MQIQQKNAFIALLLLVVSTVLFIGLLLVPYFHIPPEFEPRIVLSGLALYGVFIVVCVAKINAVVVPKKANARIVGPTATAIIQRVERLKGPFSGCILDVTVMSKDRPNFDAQLLTLKDSPSYQVGDKVSVIYDSVDPTKIMLSEDHLPDV